MDTAATTSTTAPRGDVVVRGIGDLADHLVDLAERLNTTGQAVSEMFAPLREAAEMMADHARRIAAAGRSDRLASLTLDARRIARGRSDLAVRIAHLITDLRTRGRHYEANLVAAAVRGDDAACRDIGDLLREGSPLALVVLAIVSDLDDLTDAVSVFVAEVAALISESTGNDLRDISPALSPPRILLAGSLDRTAPPATPAARPGVTRYTHEWEAAYV